ncbi:MAG: hypothetical protein DME25_21250 [Verrucomicrobia bacterium]|nr:MAG: hypothetical protein DME25_21250 [Verrucomicrobiota bacterium]
MFWVSSRLRCALVVLLGLTLSLIAAEPAKPGGVELSKIKARLLTPISTYDGQPSLCLGPQGEVWAGWVAYSHPGGDTVMAACLRNGKWSGSGQSRAPTNRPPHAL